MYPEFARDTSRWLHNAGGRDSAAAAALRQMDSEGYAHGSTWFAGTSFTSRCTSAQLLTLEQVCLMWCLTVRLALMAGLALHVGRLSSVAALRCFLCALYDVSHVSGTVVHKQPADSA